MKIRQCEHISSFIVISDVHLQTKDSQLTTLFIETLNHIQNVEALILLGDIFDFITVSKPFFFQYWKNVFDAFYALKSRGVRVYFLEGNHDFGFEHFKCPFLDDCFDLYGDFGLLLKSPKGDVFFCHSDNMICPRSYVYFRAIVKSYWFQKITDFLTWGRLTFLIFSWYAKLSRKKDKYRELNLNFVEQKLSTFLEETFVSLDGGRRVPPFLVIGHIHLDLNLPMGCGVHVYCGPAWFQRPNYLLFRDGVFHKIYLS